MDRDRITKIFSNTSCMSQRWEIFFSMLCAYVISVCFPFIRSDPYTRISLYDPVNGEITSLQTKTIKKVWLCAESDSLTTEVIFLSRDVEQEQSFCSFFF